MSGSIDTRNPNNKFDTDTEERLLPLDHYRYGLNGRSGTSDNDGVGVVEGIRGNKQVAYGAEGERVIGSCPDNKNNAIIRFVQNSTSPVAVTYNTAAMFSVTPSVVIIITTPSVPIPVGSFISVAQGGPNTFVAQVLSLSISAYILKVVNGTPSLAAIVSVTKTYYNYIRRSVVASGTQEFLTNPVLMSSVLGWVSTSRIYNPRVVEAGIAQFLVWTDPVPRLMNIDRMREG